MMVIKRMLVIIKICVIINTLLYYIIYFNLRSFMKWVFIVGYIVLRYFILVTITFRLLISLSWGLESQYTSSYTIWPDFKMNT